MDFSAFEQGVEVVRSAFGFVSVPSMGTIWDFVRPALGFGVVVMALYAIIMTLRKLEIIRETIVHFNEGRGAIWDLRQTINNLQKAEPVISRLSETLKELTAKLAEVEERIETARQQFIQSQVELISERTADPIEAHPAASDQKVDQGGDGSEAAEGRWRQLQEIWRRNTRRIEYVIDNIEDGRRRRAYDKMPRTNYNKIVDKLENAGLITAAAANASRKLNEKFNTFRPISRMVPDSEIGNLIAFDLQLNQELVDYALVEAGDDSGELPPPAPLPPVGAPGSTELRGAPVPTLAQFSQRRTNQLSN